MLKEEKSLRHFIKLILEQNSNEEIEKTIKQINNLRKYMGLSVIDMSNLDNAFDTTSNAKTESIKGLTKDRALIDWFKKYKRNPNNQTNINNIINYAEKLKKIGRKINSEKQRSRGIKKDIVFGDLKAYIRILKGTYKAKDIARFASASALGAALGPVAGLASFLGFEPLAGIIQNYTQEQIENSKYFKKIKSSIEEWRSKKDEKLNTTSALFKLFGINDNKGLQHLMLPDEVSILVDDEIEKKFVTEYLEKAILEMPDDEVIDPEFVHDLFNKYTKNDPASHGITGTYIEKK